MTEIRLGGLVLASTLCWLVPAGAVAQEVETPEARAEAKSKSSTGKGEEAKKPSASDKTEARADGATEPSEEAPDSNSPDAGDSEVSPDAGDSEVSPDANESDESEPSEAGLAEEEQAARVEAGAEPDAESAAAVSHAEAAHVHDGYELAPGVSFKPLMQYRLRYDHDEGLDFTQGTARDQARHRARLGVQGRYRDRLDVRVDIQDVRAWGAAAGGASQGPGVHQAYLGLHLPGKFEFRLGRQELLFANGRLISTRDFSERGRSYDAIRARHRTDDLLVDAFYALIRNDDTYDFDAALDEHLSGGQIAYRLNRAFRPRVLGLGHRRDMGGLRLATVGAYIDGDLFDRRLSYSAEGYYQFGEAYGDVSHSAYMAAAHVKSTFDVLLQPFVSVGLAVVSGDDDTSDLVVKSFSNDFGSKHKFHGAVDYFSKHPAGPGEVGLLDSHAAIGISPVQGLNTQVRVHLFRAMENRSGEFFGQEVDVSMKYTLWGHLGFGAVYGVFIPGDIPKAQTPDADLENRFLLTANAEL